MTVRRLPGAPDAIAAALEQIANLALKRRYAFHVDEQLPLDLGRLVSGSHITHVLMGNGYFFSDCMESIEDNVPMYLFEALPLTTQENALASSNFDQFIERLDGDHFDIEDILRPDIS